MSDPCGCATSVDDDEVDASRQRAFRWKRAHGAVQMADLAGVDALLGTSELRAARGTDLHAHELARRTGIERDDVDLVARADPYVAPDDPPAVLFQPGGGDVLVKRTAALTFCAHPPTLLAPA